LFGNPFRKVTQNGPQRIVDEAEDEGAKSFGKNEIKYIK
jgi:hypothetical protein